MVLNNKKQKLIIENFLSSGDLFARCIGIVKSEYFDPEFRQIVKFITNYYSKYHAVPSFDIVNAEFDITLKEKTITSDMFNYMCDDIEDFCQSRALIEAVYKSTEHIEKGEYAAVRTEIDKALSVALETDIGIDLYSDSIDEIRANLENAKDSQEYVSSGIKAVDKVLGGLVRKQVTLFSANSGGGKSIMLANLGAGFAKRGYNVLYFSLELPEEMVNVRLASIATGVSIRVWDQKIPEISQSLHNQKTNGAGSYIMKRIPNGSNANFMRSYLKQYEIKFGIKPDMIIVDYMDIMSPNSGRGNKSISVIDKEISEEVAELAFDYDCFMLSASQQNREALRTPSPDQGVIAGGITKVNTVDNYISIIMSDENRLNGIMWLYFLKTRSSDGVGKSVMLSFNPHNLQIGDSDEPDTIKGMMPSGADKLSRIKERKYTEEAEAFDNKEVSTDDFGNMPGQKSLKANIPDKVKSMFEELDDEADRVVKTEERRKKTEAKKNIEKRIKESAEKKKEGTKVKKTVSLEKGDEKNQARKLIDFLDDASI